MNHVVVSCLRKSDVTAQRVKKIEEAIKRAVRHAIMAGLLTRFSEDDLSFDIHPDPTVTSEKIPIIIEATLISDQRDDGFTKHRLAQGIWMEFRTTVRAWRKLGEVKVSVEFLPEVGDWYIG